MKRILFACAALVALPPAFAAEAPPEITLEVDATDLAHRVHRVRQVIPVDGPGGLTLHYPRWIPGAHAPSGDVTTLAGLRISAGGETLAWRRDPLDTHAFRVQVPARVNRLEIEFQHLSPTRGATGRITVTPEMMNLQWHTLLLYPANRPIRQTMVRPSLTLPAGWQAGTALRPLATEGPTLRFAPVSVEMLIDSPVFAGRHFRRIELDPKVALNLVADSADKLQPSEAQIEAHRELVRQADRLFASRHFVHYDFLLALTDEMGGIGLEHHQSSENAVRSTYWDGWDKRPASRMLLPHEYVHSWNGKFRRPADLLTPHYNTPMRNSLLWLYEGQTEFWGWVLAARSGLISAAQARDVLARTAAYYDHQGGRAWRSLQDTTDDPIAGYRRSKDWPDWQRGAGDYYLEALLVWLDADSLIREKSGGTRSLDDFARAFFGIRDGELGPVPYTFDDVVAALNAVQPHDWAGFLRQRLDATGAPAPLEGIARGGWKLVYTETPNDSARADEAEERYADFRWSIGLMVGTPGGTPAPGDDGLVSFVRWGGPAYEAGIVPGTRIVAVNGMAYKRERLQQALAAHKGGQAPLQLLLRDGERFRTVTIDWRGGARHPRLERVEGTEDRLGALLARRP